MRQFVPKQLETYIFSWSFTGSLTHNYLQEFTAKLLLFILKYELCIHEEQSMYE